MKTYILNFTKNHSLAFLYILIFTTIVIGVIVNSGFKYIHFLVLYIAVFVATYYFIYSKFKHNHKLIDTFQDKIYNHFAPTMVAHVLIICTILFALAHLVYLNEIPILKALNCRNSDTISIIRNNIADNKHFLWNYGTSFVIKALLPFFTLYLYIRKEKVLFLIFLSFGLFYTISLIAKSPVVTLFVPILFYSILKRKFLHFVVFILILVFSIAFIVYTTNPSLRGIKDEANIKTVQVDNSNSNPIINGIKGVFNRTVLAPGEVVSNWFTLIPDKRPFLYGTGYRFIAPLKHQEFTNYSLVLYSDLYPENTEKGIKGSYNVASFMEEYSNFGIWGLVLSGIFLGLFFAFLQLLFINSKVIAFSINANPILLLSSTAIPTLFFSGGWGLLVLLSLFFNKSMNSFKLEKVNHD